MIPHYATTLLQCTKTDDDPTSFTLVGNAADLVAVSQAQNSIQPFLTQGCENPISLFFSIFDELFGYFVQLVLHVPKRIEMV